MQLSINAQASHAPPVLRKLCSPVSVQRRLLQLRFQAAGLRKERSVLGSGQVSYWTGGNGPPLLLIPGFGATAIWQWHAQVGALQKRYRLVVPDLLFFGESRSSRVERTLDAQALAMKELLDFLQIDSSHVLGLSYGGFVAYALATQFPNKVRKLLLNNSPGPVMRQPEVNDMLKSFQVQKVHDLFLPEEYAGIRRLMAVGWHRAPKVPDWILRDAHRVLYSNQVQEKHELLSQLLSLLQDPEALALHVPHPTLIIWGAHDPVFPLHLAHRLKRHIGSKAQVQVIEQAAHAPNLERPRIFNRIVLEYLEQ